MAIGVNWKEIWVTPTVWKAVWTQSPPAPTPTPDVTTPTPAGKSRRKAARYYVEIDGQRFDVDSPDEAVELLQRARAIAEHQAEERGERATKQLKRNPRVPQVELKRPEITASPEIRTDLAPLIDDIKRLYAKAAEVAELRLLMMQAERVQRDEDDDEDDLLLLL